jgi:hypothetical protein
MIRELQTKRLTNSHQCTELAWLLGWRVEVAEGSRCSWDDLTVELLVLLNTLRRAKVQLVGGLAVCDEMSPAVKPTHHPGAGHAFDWVWRFTVPGKGVGVGRSI